MAYSDVGQGLLTERELEVLEALADGLRSSEIAARRNASVKTFYAVCKSLRAKLGASNDVHAVSIGFRRGLLVLERRSSPAEEGEVGVSRRWHD